MEYADQVLTNVDKNAFHPENLTTNTKIATDIAFLRLEIVSVSCPSLPLTNTNNLTFKILQFWSLVEETKIKVQRGQ